MAGATLALVFMRDGIWAVAGGPAALERVLPTTFHWPLFVPALLMMGATVVDAARQATRTSVSVPETKEPSMTPRSFNPDWRPARAPYLPAPFTQAPRLDPELSVGRPQRGEILLINPFYRKDAHASFGKHVLTPSLALTSIAGATPEGWRVRYWDENLLQGPRPTRPS